MSVVRLLTHGTIDVLGNFLGDKRRDPPTARVTRAGHGSNHAIGSQSGLQRLGIEPSIEDLLPQKQAGHDAVNSRKATTFMLQTFIIGAVKIS